MHIKSKLTKEFFNRDTVEVAKLLLGKVLKHGKTSGIIVETEAYKGKEDEASHAFKRTERSGLMYDSYGKFYIYFVYGKNFCINVTAEKKKAGAVLIRALEPLSGIDIMKKRRKTDDIGNLTNGPGKLCQALGINKKFNGTEINDKIEIFNTDLRPEIIKSSRIGIQKAKDFDWRFYIKDNKFVSVR